jgi:hypothetical protein
VSSAVRPSFLQPRFHNSDSLLPFSPTPKDTSLAYPKALFNRPWRITDTARLEMKLTGRALVPYRLSARSASAKSISARRA